MKGLFTAVAFLFIFGSCKESGVELSKPSTFVKYLSDGLQDQAIDVLETSDKGYLILAHSDSSNGHGGIYIIKTDLSGNTLWETSFRKSGNDLSPSNFVAMKDTSGNDLEYVIVGTILNAKFGARLYVMRIKSDGAFKDSISYYTTGKLGDATNYRKGQNDQGAYVIGKGVAQSANLTKDIFVIGQVVQHDLVTSVPTDINGKGGDMYFVQINGKTLDTVFTKIYGAGTSNLANRLFLDNTQTSAYWGGTRTDGQGTHVRFINSGFNSQLTNFDLPYPTGQSGYKGNDISPYGYGFSIVGNDLAGKNIVLVSVGSEGNELRPMINLPSDNSSIIQISGNSVCSTLDGGLLVLGTNAVDAQGTNTDYTLIKLDGSGAQSWERTHGGKYLDVGVKVLQSSDGGYVVLGTTTLANVKTVFFMKADSQGNIQ